MDRQDFLQHPFGVSDWLELGDRLSPGHRQCMLGILELEETKLGGSRENLRQAERMMAESQALLDKMRGLRQAAGLQPEDHNRLDAVVATVEQTRRLIASHYVRLENEWRRTAGLAKADEPRVCDRP